MSIRIVYLVVNYVPHQIASINHLIQTRDVEILAFHKNGFREAVPILPNFQSHGFQDFNKNELLQKIQKFNPAIVVISGWNVPEYNWLAKKIRRSSTVPVVAMSDTPWYGTWRQKVNSLISPIFVKRMFTHIWVAGYRQYEYARRLGFSTKEILLNSLSADVEMFQQITKNSTEAYPRNFIFVGRFTEVKGIGMLLDAWRSIDNKNGWTLTLIGEGELKNELSAIENVIIKDFMPHSQLLKEFQMSGCFVLPSIHEPWALVIHEAAAAGLPILCTNICGAAPHFVIEGYTGFTYDSNNIYQLTEKMQFMMKMEDEDLFQMSVNCRSVSNSINLDLVVASLFQISGTNTTQ